MTQIAALPLLSLALQTGTNEDWSTPIAFAVTTGRATATPRPGTVGNGVVLAAGTVPPDLYLQVIAVDPTPTFLLFYQGGEAGPGVIGPQGYSAVLGNGALTAVMLEGTVPFAVGDTFDIVAQPIDLTGIGFALAVKTDPLAGATAFTASSTAGTLLVPQPTSGVLQIAVPKLTMKSLAPRPYVFDILAIAEISKRCVTGSLDLIAGITSS